MVWDGTTWQQWNAGTCTNVAAAADGSAYATDDCKTLRRSGEPAAAACCRGLLTVARAGSGLRVEPWRVSAVHPRRSLRPRALPAAARTSLRAAAGPWEPLWDASPATDVALGLGARRAGRQVEARCCRWAAGQRGLPPAPRLVPAPLGHAGARTCLDHLPWPPHPPLLLAHHRRHALHPRRLRLPGHLHALAAQRRVGRQRRHFGCALPAGGRGVQGEGEAAACGCGPVCL